MGSSLLGAVALPHLLGSPRDAELTASKRLAARLTRCCPDYGTPGYGAVAAECGLPCAACAAPTDWVAVLVDGCARSARRRPRPRSRDDGLRPTDPAHYARCNP